MNLIICTTPFQAALASKIIDLEKEKEYFLIMFFSEDNEKYRYYYNKLANKVSKSIYIYSPPIRNKMKYINFLVRMKVLGVWLSIFYKFKSFYIASLDATYIHILIHNLFNKGSSTLYSYDDGSANIDRSSFLYKDEVKRKVWYVKKFLCPINTIGLREIKELSLKHYSIFRNMPNIIDNVAYIDFMEDNYLQINNKSIMKIFLGQPIYDVENISEAKKIDKYSKLIDSIISKFDIEFYFPHPKERFVIKGVKYINTKLIAEDYILSQLDKGNRIVLYTFFSSVAFSLSKIEGVEVISLLPSELPDEFGKVYDLVREFNIPIVNLG